MLKQVPKLSTTRSEVEAKTKSSTGTRSSPKFLELPKLTRQEIEDLVSDSAINQQLEKMKAKGLISKGVISNEPVFKIAADVVDAVRWHDQKNEELRNMKTQDVEQKNPWVDDLIENFIAFDPSPYDTASKAKEIMKQLQIEITDLEDAGYGPDARDYIFKLKRELELIIEKVS